MYCNCSGGGLHPSRLLSTTCSSAQCGGTRSAAHSSAPMRAPSPLSCGPPPWTALPCLLHCSRHAGRRVVISCCLRSTSARDALPALKRSSRDDMNNSSTLSALSFQVSSVASRHAVSSAASRQNRIFSGIQSQPGVGALLAHIRSTHVRRCCRCSGPQVLINAGQANAATGSEGDKVRRPHIP